MSEEEKEQIHNQDQSGQQAWGKIGVAVNSSSDLKACLFTGAKFEKSLSVLVPNDDQDLLAIYEFTRDPQFARLVREIDKKVLVANRTLVKVPFDRAQWQAVASARFPEGIPARSSNDPTQWQFHGHPTFADAGTELHVALARIAGYRWPAETNATMQLSDLAKDRIEMTKTLPVADSDGLLVTHANGASMSLADRLRVFLSAAYEEPLSPNREQALIRAADMRLDKKEARDTTLEGWLADRAFRQHCILFQQRPFLWQIWDGMKDGFSAFVNYHHLNRSTFDKLTYTLLGDWIRAAKPEGNIARLERAEQLQQKLAKIIEGESPHDIFVRWKPLDKQPLGWDPDLDDGVRLNIRPFMRAGILRDQPRINWNKDRGASPSSSPWYGLGLRYGDKQGDRINEHHTTLAEKRTAREMS